MSHLLHRSLLPSVISGISWVGLGVAFQATMRIGTLAVMARLVTPRDFGIFSMAMIFTSFAERIGEVGIGAAFVQRAAIDRDDLKTAWVLSLTSGVLISGVLCCTAPVAANIFGEAALTPVLIALSLGFIADSWGVVSDGLLQRELRFREIVRAEAISFVFGIIGVGIALGLAGWGIWALVFGNLAMRVSRSLLRLWIRWPSLDGRWSFQRARVLLSTGVGFSMGKVLNFLSLQGDNFVVGRILGAEALGMYTRAYQAMTLPAMYVGQAFERVLFPAMSQKQDELQVLKKGLLATLEVSTLVALPVGVGMFFLCEEIVLVLFGTGWRPVIPVLTILSCGVFCRAAYKCSDVIIRSKGDLRAYVMRQACYTSIIVGGSFIGATINGLQGVAYAVVLGVAINYILMTRLAGRLSGTSLTELIGSHLPGVWVSAWIVAVMAVTLPTIRTLCSSPLLVLICATLLGALTALIAWRSSWSLMPDSYARLLLHRLVRRVKVA